jgi:hypothetical protein
MGLGNIAAARLTPRPVTRARLAALAGLVMLAATCQRPGDSWWSDADSITFEEQGSAKAIVVLDIPDGALVDIHRAQLLIRVEAGATEPHPRLELEVAEPVDARESFDAPGNLEFRWRIDEALDACAKGCHLEIPVTFRQVDHGEASIFWMAALEVQTEAAKPPMGEVEVRIVDPATVSDGGEG